MKLLRKVFFQLINKKLRRMKQMHDDDSVVLRRKNKKIAADSSGLGDRRRLSWSISDLSRLPAVRTSSSLVKTRCSRVRNTSISSCSLSSGPSQSSHFSLLSSRYFQDPPASQYGVMGALEGRREFPFLASLREHSWQTRGK